jgi:galactokinase
MSVTSDVPIGSGLSSSAALECAVLGALASAAGLRIDSLDRARLAQRAENEFVGAPTGLLDQLVSLYGQAGRALLIDFRELSVRPVAFDPEAVGVGLRRIVSRARPAPAGGDPAARAASGARAAADLGVSSLREVQDRGATDVASTLAAVRDPLDARRARHVLTENRRVLEAAAALEAADFAAAGGVLTASHASMRDDFGITTDHIDLIADTAVGAGALGARMTGGGFGGCVIALVPHDRTEPVATAVRRAMSEAGFPEPAIGRTGAAAGAAPCA